MVTVLIAPQGRGDPSPDELARLAGAISRILGLDVEVALAKIAPPGMAGVTWWEVVNIWIPGDHVRDAFIGAVVAEFVRRARNRFRDQPENNRPKAVRILGPDGRVLKSVNVQSPEAVPGDTTADETEANIVYRRPDLD